MNDPTTFRAGEALVLLAVLVWLSVSVGPWWVGIAIFIAGSLANRSASRLKR